MTSTLLKNLWKIIISYLAEKLYSKTKEALPKAIVAFKETLWKELKEDILACARETIHNAEKFLSSVEAQQKEEIILNLIMTKINLPILLKPFKKIIKNIIKEKLETFIHKNINKGKELLNQSI